MYLVCWFSSFPFLRILNSLICGHHNPGYCPSSRYHQFLPICYQHIEKASSLIGLSTLHQKFFFDVHQGLDRNACAFLCYLPADIMVIKVPNGNQFLQFGNCCELFKESLVHLFLLVWWLIADAHCATTIAVLDSDLDREMFSTGIPLTLYHTLKQLYVFFIEKAMPFPFFLYHS